jgi:uncharacterized protein
MIRQAEISILAHQLGLGEKTIEKDYVLTWLLHSITKSPLVHNLAFKGGTAIKKIYVQDYRFSEDLDFTMLDPLLTSMQLMEKVKGLFPWLRQAVNLQMALERYEDHQTGNLTLYLNYIGPLQSQLEKRSLKVDFSFDENLAFPLMWKPIQSSYSDCGEHKGLLNVYSMEEILTEKLRSLITRSEPRDLFDVHHIISQRLADLDAVFFNCAPKFSTKNLELSDLRTILDRKYQVFKGKWHQRLDGQMTDIPEYDQVIRETKRVLMSAF